MEEEHSQMANIHRGGNNNGDGNIVGNSTYVPVEQQGSDKSSTSNEQQLDRNKSEGMELVKEIGL